MAIEIKKGIVESLRPAEEDKPCTCRVGGNEIELHPDLADRLKDGDDVAISGHESENGLKALAINNLTRKKVSSIDPSNTILLLGFSGFASFLFFVLGMQNYFGGAMNLALTNLVLVLAGLTGAVISFGRFLAVRSALKMINYL